MTTTEFMDSEQNSIKGDKSVKSDKRVEELEKELQITKKALKMSNMNYWKYKHHSHGLYVGECIYDSMEKIQDYFDFNSFLKKGKNFVSFARFLGTGDMVINGLFAGKHILTFVRECIKTKNAKALKELDYIAVREMEDPGLDDEELEAFEGLIGVEE